MCSLTQRQGIKLRSGPGGLAVELRIHRGSGECCSWCIQCFWRLLFQESAETAKPAHAVDLLTESMRPVSFTMKWCWLAPGEADTGVARVWLCTAKLMPAKSIFQYIWAWLSLQSGFVFFLKYNFNVYRKCILFVCFLFKWCGVFILFGRCHR